MTPMPEKYKDKFYHRNIPCDMAVGAYSCGAWHKLKEWPKEVQDSIKAEK